METQQIIQSLSYITWVLLGSLALGSFALVWALAQATDVTSGFLSFSAFLAAVFGLGWLVTEWGLPAPTEVAIQAGGLDEPRRAVIGLFIVLAVISGVRFRQGHHAVFVGAATVVAGIAAMGVAAYAWIGGEPFAMSLLVHLLALTLVTGGSLAAVVLAHWYLVTPRISERPLILATRILFWALAVQLLLYWVWIASGMPDGEPFAALTGSNAVFVWLRLLVGLVFPLVLVWMAWRTASTRSMESATGLLYIELAVVMASTIVAAGLFFGEGLLV